MKTKKKVTADQIDESEVIEEAEGVDTSALEGMSKTNAMSVVMKAMSDMTGDNFVNFFKAVQAQAGKFGSGVEDGASAQNAASVEMKGKVADAIKEDIALVFGDNQELSEEFKAKATTLLESAVNARVAIIEAELQEAYTEAFEEEIGEVHQHIVEEIDEYLSFMVDQYMKENAPVFKRAVRAELAEDFIAALGQLFIEHNYNVPDDQVEVVDALAEKVDNLEEDYNKALLRIIDLEKENNNLNKDRIINVMSENLTDIETEKFKTLVEGFELDDSVETYIEKLETIKNHHFNKTTPKTNLITEEVEYTEEEVENEIKESTPKSVGMKKYLQALKETQNTF